MFGGLADGSPDPRRHALRDHELLALLPATSVAMIVGYTEREGERLFNTAAIARDGTVLVKARPYEEDLLIADVPSVRPPHDARGWDGARNPAVAAAFLRLWEPK